MSIKANPASLLFALAEYDQRIFFAIDLKSRSFLYANPAFYQFFNSTAEISLDTILCMVHPEDLAYLKEIFAALKPGVFKNNVEFRIAQSGKKERLVQLSGMIHPQQNDEPFLSGYMEDVSEYRAHSDKVNEFANKKNAILNILSHDLAGPLGSIQNLSALIARKTKTIEDQEVKKWISLIEEISKKSVLMIQDFVKREFIESAGVALVKKKVDLNLIFRNAAKEYQEKQQELNKIFVYETNSNQLFAEIDESKFFQAVNNLISNALKFTPDGGTISLKLEDKGTVALVTVADNGIGIPRKYHAHLFEKFNDARRPGLRGEPSVGLGMSIIKTIVEWHKGKIWFESEEQKGSTFYIEIPKNLSQ